MSVAALPRTDPAPVKSSDFYDQWVSNLVDTFNQAMQQIENGLVFSSEVTGTSQQMDTNKEYIPNNSGLVVLTLPINSVFGDKITVVGKGSGGWRISQNASQLIHVGSTPTTTGVGGSISSTNRYDNLMMQCIVDNLEWTVVNKPMGTLTIV